MEDKNEKGLAELFLELSQEVKELKTEVRGLSSQLSHTLRIAQIDEVAVKVEQSLARKIRTQLKKD